MKKLALTATLIATAFGAQAHDYRIGDLEVSHPYAYETAKTAHSAGGYMTLTNTGTKDAHLVGAKADYPRVEIHTTQMENGVMTMSHVEKITIPAGESVTFQHGGLHVMFMGLNGKPFVEGDKIPTVLEFEDLGTLDIMFNVEKRPGTAGQKKMDHSQMHHGHGDKDAAKTKHHHGTTN